MHRVSKRLQLYFATSVALMLFAKPQTGVADTISMSLSNSTAQLQQYQRSRSLADLEHASEAMQGALNLDELTPQNFIEKRREFVRGWANVIRSIETSYDATFDPNAYVRCPVPPGGNLAPCADPKDITDSYARSTYSAQLNAYYNFQHKRREFIKLQTIDRGAMNYLQGGLDLMRKVAPDGTSSDFAALDAILGQANVSTSRRSKIDSMFYSRPGG